MLAIPGDTQSQKLRDELTLWLRDHKPPQISPSSELEAFVSLSREWQRKLAAERWVGVHWPEEFGGRGLRFVDEAVVQEVLAAHGAPQLVNLFGLTMVGPVLIAYGSQEQKERYLSKILSADEIWCQGFSEPGAGSDLAALKTAAQWSEEKGSWLVSGQKVWTSFAQYADWCFLLARTTPATESASPHEGLTYFLVPMTQPGITVRPLEQITEESEFNEVFFDSVSIAPEWIVGAPGSGWKIAITTLMYERVILTLSRHLQSEKMLGVLRSQLARLKAEKGQQGGWPEKSSWQEKIGRLIARSDGVRTLALAHLAEYEKGGTPGPEGSLDKLGWSEVFQDICKAALQLDQELGRVQSTGSLSMPTYDTELIKEYLYSRGRTIAAGTSEIQRNIIAERILGLPKFPAGKNASGKSSVGKDSAGKSR